MTIPVLFLSGAGLPPWIWDDVRAGISTASFVATRLSGAERGLDDYARAALDSFPAERFAMVAHSAGGVVATQIAAIAPERVMAVLGIAAVIPVRGRSFTSSLPYPGRAVLPVALRLAGTRPPASSIRTSLAAGVDDETVRRLVSDFEPESRRYFTDRTNGGDALRAVPRRMYLATTSDREMPLNAQRRYATQLAVQDPVELPGGHLPMLLHPAAVTAVVQDLIDGS